MGMDAAGKAIMGHCSCERRKCAAETALQSTFVDSQALRCFLLRHAFDSQQPYNFPIVLGELIVCLNETLEFFIGAVATLRRQFIRQDVQRSGVICVVDRDNLLAPCCVGQQVTCRGE